MDTEMGAWEYQHHVADGQGKGYAGSREFELGDDDEDEGDARR
jgi:hypothetical protein